MSNYDFMMTSAYNDIKNQIIQLWNDYDKDGQMDDIIDEFKNYYGNTDNCVYLYDWDNTSSKCVFYIAQRYVLQKMSDAGFDMTIDDMLKIATEIGLKSHLVYWIMDEIDFEELV